MTFRGDVRLTRAARLQLAADHPPTQENLGHVVHELVICRHLILAGRVGG